MPRTPLEWVIFGASIGGGAIFGAVARAFGLSKRVGAAETAAAAAVKDAAAASAAAAAAKDAATALVTAALATLRGELAPVAARADAAVQAAQAASAGASNPTALRGAINDALEANRALQILTAEVDRLRAAEVRGADNTLRMNGALERIAGKLEGL
jgi:hypothetical protein